MVSRISLFDLSEVIADLSDTGYDGMSGFTMVDNNTAYAVTWKFMGLEHEPDPEDPYDSPWAWPYAPQLVKITWDGDSCTHQIVATLENMFEVGGQIHGCNYWDSPIAINHIHYGVHDYVVVIFHTQIYIHWHDERWPLPCPNDGIKVFCYGTDSCEVNLMLPWDDDTLLLGYQGISKGSIYHSNIFYAVDCVEHSVPPVGWVFPGDPCPPTGNNYCPCPTLIITGSGASWAADVTVPCAGWNGGGFKEYILEEFHQTKHSAADNTNGNFFYPAVRVDYGTNLMQCSGGTLSIAVESTFDAHTLFNGKDHAYGIHGYGQLFVLPNGPDLITVPVSADGYDQVNHAMDDKYDMIWSITPAGLVGQGIHDPLLDRTIAVDWPINPTSGSPSPYPDGSETGSYAIRILAGEVALLAQSGSSWHLLMLKENVPMGYSRYWP